MIESHTLTVLRTRAELDRLHELRRRAGLAAMTDEELLRFCLRSGELDCAETWRAIGDFAGEAQA